MVPLRKLFGGKQKSSEQREFSTSLPVPSRACSTNSSPEIFESDQANRRQSKASTAPTSSYSIPVQACNQKGKTHRHESGQLGLNIVHAPSDGHRADIIFIHGLGGASWRTWCKNEDPELFWPATFLPLEPGICQTRIMTFGYNANFRAAGKVSVSVLDFAKDLLFDLRYAKDRQGEDLAIGDVSMIQERRSA